MKIILDAMGGDNAPEAPVLGAVEAAKTYGIEIVLVGRVKQPNTTPSAPRRRAFSMSFSMMRCSVEE